VTQFTSDLSQNLNFKKDDRNFINELSLKQLNSLGNTSLLDIYLSQSTVIEPHYHPNSSELIYCICGSAVVSLLNPITKELLHFPVSPGQVANLPQGWLHYIVATADNTHLLAIFDAPIPQIILVSDFLRMIPSNVLAYTYCLDKDKVEDALSPLQQSVVLGPPAGCCEHHNMHGKKSSSNHSYTPNHGYYHQDYTGEYMQQPYVQQSPYVQYPGIER
jgi:oxalate decarboxylase/phosphoglucose isomerase-like protein (cupin superfamily)